MGVLDGAPFVTYEVTVCVEVEVCSTASVLVVGAPLAGETSGLAEVLNESAVIVTVTGR